MAKTERLTPMVSPTPPRGKRSAIGAPRSTKTKQADAMANFFSISTRYWSMVCWATSSSKRIPSSITSVMVEAGWLALGPPAATGTGGWEASLPAVAGTDTIAAAAGGGVSRPWTQASRRQ